VSLLSLQPLGVSDCFIVAIGYVIFSDFISGGLPYFVMGHDVTEDLVEILDTMRLTDDIRVKRNAHDPPALLSL
jgi:hypothetical protein